MPAQISMLHIRIDDQVKARATDALSRVGLARSDAPRRLMIRFAIKGGGPSGLTTGAGAYDVGFRAMVQEATADLLPATSHDRGMEETRAPIDGVRLA